jgi:8-amino-7-oxononanoate synthase
MSGDLANRDIFSLANSSDALLIVDEAHSSGTIGKNLLGIFDYYNLEIKSNYIKMGTLGKAYGSYGAYILSSKEIKSFLINRGKPIIYSTAPSVFDTALALVNLKYILKHKNRLYKKIQKRKNLIKDILQIETNSLIVPIEQASNKQTKELQKELLNKGYLVGAIRQPTVEKPIIRLIPRLGVGTKELKKVLKYFNMV